MKYKEWLDVWFANYIKPSYKKKLEKNHRSVYEVADE